MSTNPIVKAMDQLREEGWFCELTMPCCQSCAWSSIPYEHEYGPFKGEKVDLDKVLFNHEQDMELDFSEECTWCFGEGGEYRTGDEEEEWFDCEECFGSGYIDNESRYLTEDELTDTYFCHAGGPNMARAKEVMEENGVRVDWEVGNDDVRMWVRLP